MEVLLVIIKTTVAFLYHLLLKTILCVIYLVDLKTEYK